MGKSRKGYIMGSKLHKMALCKSPLRQVESKVTHDIGEQFKNIAGEVITKKTIPKYSAKGLLAGTTGAGGTILATGGTVLTGIAAAKTIGGIKNYLDEHGTEVKAFKDQPSWQDLSKKAGGPTITSSLPDYLKSNKQLKEEKKL